MSEAKYVQSPFSFCITLSLLSPYEDDLNNNCLIGFQSDEFFPLGFSKNRNKYLHYFLKFYKSFSLNQFHEFFFQKYSYQKRYLNYLNPFLLTLSFFLLNML